MMVKVRIIRSKKPGRMQLEQRNNQDGYKQEISTTVDLVMKLSRLVIVR